MLQIEIISSNDENDLVFKVNYFLSKIDECLIRDIKYSSFVFENEVIYSCLILLVAKVNSVL